MHQLAEFGGEFGRVENGVDAFAGGAVLEEDEGGVEVLTGVLTDLADGLTGHRIVDEHAQGGGDRAAHRRHGQRDLPAQGDREAPHGRVPGVSAGAGDGYGDGVWRVRASSSVRSHSSIASPFQA